MTSLKIMLIDARRCKFQFFIFLFLIIFSMFFFTSDMIISYFTFMAIIFSSQPFLYEQRSESGFLCMLPATKENRTLGRYLFGLLFIIFIILASLLTNAVFLFTGQSLPRDFFFQLNIHVGIGLITIALQYILFYALGKLKSQQLLGIIMMLPGFVVFFLFLLLPDQILQQDIFYWIIRKRELISSVIALISPFIWLLSLFISIQISKRKDFI